MPKGRSWSTEEYRYGFNGMEKDDEFSVEDGSYDFGARMYDERLGRWWSVDSQVHMFDMLSPYNFAGGNPIYFVDPDGKTIKPVGDSNGNTSPAISLQALHTYMITAFGSELAGVFMSSYSAEDGKLGIFANETARNAFSQNFLNTINLMNDEHEKSLAMGVYEAIMSPNEISFIAYPSNAGFDLINSNRKYDLEYKTKKDQTAENSENYVVYEPMVLGTPNLRELENGVDVLYDTSADQNPDTWLDCGLVAVSDGDMINTGTLTSPYLTTPRGVGPGQSLPLAISVMANLAATNYVLSRNLTFVDNELSDRQGGGGKEDRQMVVRNDQQFFRNISTNLLGNKRVSSALGDIPIPSIMTRQNRQAIRFDQGGRRDIYSPRRQNFSSDDGR